MKPLINSRRLWERRRRYQNGVLSGLLTEPHNEAKWLIRIVTGNLCLGIADMTVLDALAIAYGGGKEARDKIERAYNISSRSWQSCQCSC